MRIITVLKVLVAVVCTPLFALTSFMRWLGCDASGRESRITFREAVDDTLLPMAWALTTRCQTVIRHPDFAGPSWACEVQWRIANRKD